MKITDIIRHILDIVDHADESDQTVSQLTIAVPSPEEELADIKHLAGYANDPNEVEYPITASFPSGTDVHHSKNPADIRTNAPSMYPNHQHKATN
jgi:hypothetical protein